MKTIRPKIQRGFSLITAIFLLVVVASLGTLMITFFSAQQQASAIEALGARAYQTARLGIEWGAYQITQSGVASAAGSTFASECFNNSRNPPATQPSMAKTKLSEFNLVVFCTYTLTPFDTASSGVYNIIAAASGVNGAMPGSIDYVERELQASIDATSGILYQREKY